MPNVLRNISTRDDTSFPYIFEQNVDIPLIAYGKGLIRVNLYLPKGAAEGTKYPVLLTHGPYGKDVSYEAFRKPSFDQVNPEHKSSPGVLDTMSAATSEGFFDVVEWAADQPWSNGKVGLLGISYYAESQWRVAARKPRGLAAIIPWEGMSDYHRDRVRHGGILSDKFIRFWWNAQVVVNQYGRPRREGSPFPPTIEGELSPEELSANLNDQTVNTAKFRFRDEDYFASKDFKLEDIVVPLLSGGILLHLRGNVEGYVHAGSSNKYLRFITGRHDLPFYYSEEAALQNSFLDAFLKDSDVEAWSTPGKLDLVSVVLREGDVGVNDAEKEKVYKRRGEKAWPIPRIQYQKLYLGKDASLSKEQPSPTNRKGILAYNALSNIPSDLDLFLTIRHLDAAEKEIFYTGTAGDSVPVTKGWLRCSLRKTNPSHPYHREYLPYREYHSSDAELLNPGEVYSVDVEIWPTNVVVGEGNKLVFEIAGTDTQGCGIFKHEDPDRKEAVFKGLNQLHFGSGEGNYVTLPYIPEEGAEKLSSI
ncbi:hypothetical protein G7Y89_g10321 [Cudoniella acicularis]|uniref:Xaa-Pro dipeptidyl-peptidase C-terminal domain-containing protein n=1 Tax=Cudoniella acicularis TaxID=354080 RepID=A0A8H4RD10_9HELO|nr:hypothetical protein G7Y89_g10321 [Cudoniella acicularis]